jgi:hypothetical protein
LQSKLFEHLHEAFAHLLDDFVPSDAQSRAATESGNVTWRGRSYAIDNNCQAFLIRMSDLLAMNEALCYGMLQAYLVEEFSGTDFDFSDSNLANVIGFVHAERRALVYLVATLYKIAGDAAHPYYSPANEEVQRLIPTLSDTLIRQLSTTCHLQSD